MVSHIEWLETLEDTEGFCGLVIGNEVIDALPCKRFVIREGKILELGVGLEEGNPAWRDGEFDKGFHEQVSAGLPAQSGVYPEGYRSEFNTGLGAWLDSLNKHVDQGLFVFIDYGFDGLLRY